MTPKFISLLELCLENGVDRGLRRAYKHQDDPSSEQIKNAIMLEIWNEIHEWFDLDA